MNDFEGPGRMSLSSGELSARLEPFDSYWQAPKDVERGFGSFRQYYKRNFLPAIPHERDCEILVVSCGPGYLLDVLTKEGHRRVLGIDSDPEKVLVATRRGLPAQVARAFEFLRDRPGEFDVIVCEQELNHLTKTEMFSFLRLCHESLRGGGTLVVYGLNGANPIVGAENLAHNIDHFHTFTETSLRQSLEVGGFEEIRVLPLKLYVFYKNPLNYVGWGVTWILEFGFRWLFRLYGKKVRVLTKKIAAVCRKPR